METNYNYTCPNCAQECSVVESLTGQDVVCPNCNREFFATTPDKHTEIVLPEKLPFFKAGRKKILEEKFNELVADGEMSKQDDQALQKAAILLGLGQADLDEITKTSFFKDFEPIRLRVEKSWHLTDRDLEEIEALKVKYGVEEFKMEGTADVFRRIYLLEERGELPGPISTDLMLDEGEITYHSIGATWHQSRVQTAGYAATGVSIPTGIKGVRFRFGQSSPIRTESLALLARGILWVTSKRLIFRGDRRNANVTFKRIIDTEVYTDALRVEKATGKPEFFGMHAAEARYVASLIESLKNQ